MSKMLMYNTNAPKKAANLTINSDLLMLAKQLHVNLSKVLEQRLIELLQEKARQQWLEQNKEAIETYNESVSKRGVFSDGMRRF